MKRILFIMAAVALGIAVSCNKVSGTDDNDVQTGGDSPVVAIAVTDIADNMATVTATLTEGSFYGGKIVTGFRVSDMTIDYTNEIRLVQWLEENGTEISEMPYTVTLTNLVYEQGYLCAVLVYDATGRACSSAWATFVAEGYPVPISDENSAGNLDDHNPVL